MAFLKPVETHINLKDNPVLSLHLMLALEHGRLSKIYKIAQGVDLNSNFNDVVNTVAIVRNSNEIRDRVVTPLVYAVACEIPLCSIRMLRALGANRDTASECGISPNLLLDTLKKMKSYKDIALLEEALNFPSYGASPAEPALS